LMTSSLQNVSGGEVDRGRRGFATSPLVIGDYLFFVPNSAVTSVNGPEIVIRYVAELSLKDFVARL